jgi:Holliday junction resolvase RusA-like endonuclease
MADTIDLSFESDTECEEGEHVSLKLVRCGDPIPKPVPRVKSQVVGRGWSTKNPVSNSIVRSWAYNPASVDMKEFKANAKEQFLSQVPAAIGGLPAFPVIKDGPVSIKIWVCKRPNNSFFINKDRSRPRNQLFVGFYGGPYAIKRVCYPDTDNCVKFILDSLKGVAWTDDNQVCQLVAYKCIDSIKPYEGRTIVEVTDQVEIGLFPQWSIIHSEPTKEDPIVW